MPRRPRVPKKRIQYDVTEKQGSQIEQLMRLLNCVSVAECLRRSVDVLLKIVKKVNDGYDLELVRREKKGGAEERVRVEILSNL